MKIVVWRDGFDGSFLYRLGLPLTAAAGLGLADPVFRDVGSEADGDVVIAQRFMHPGDLDIWDATASPLKVMEFDDDLLDLPRTSNYFKEHDYEEYRQVWVPRLVASLDACDLITVSVPYLAERFARHTQTPIVVLPNTIHQVLLGTTASQRGPGENLRVGWAGTDTHGGDWDAHATGITRALRGLPTDLVIVGADYRHKLDVPSTYRPWSNSLTDYYASISDFHVMLAPLAESTFNNSKSPLKALEAAALGIPTVAAATGPYVDFIVNGETGFLCSTGKDWERALRTLAYDEDARRAMGDAARDRARAWVTQDWAPRWIEAYAAAMERKGVQIGA